MANRPRISLQLVDALDDFSEDMERAFSDDIVTDDEARALVREVREVSMLAMGIDTMCQLAVSLVRTGPDSRSFRDQLTAYDTDVLALTASGRGFTPLDAA